MSLVDSTGHSLPATVTLPHSGVSLEVLRWQAQLDFDATRITMALELPSITREGKIQLKPGTKPIPFVRFEDLHAAIMPILHKHGFYATFQGVEKNGDFWAQAYLRRNGCWLMSEWPVDRKPVSSAMNPNQATAAGFSLACRHALIRLLNLRSHDPQDADTDAAEPVKAITAAQLRKLEAEIGDDEVLKHKIKINYLDVLQIAGLAQLPSSELRGLSKSIATYKARLKQ